MQLEFDKEIDAILRKSRQAGNAAPSSSHLDADMIAAFADNALPQVSRTQYTLHLADCDRCRKYLSQTISMNEQAVDPAAAIHVAAPAAEVSVPWYKLIFRTPNLAVAMGALVLVFSGILGFFVLRNDSNSGNTLVSQVSEQEATRGGPYVPGDGDTPNSNAAAAGMPQQFSTANTMAPAPTAMTNTAANSTARTTQTDTLAKEMQPAVPTVVEEKGFSARQSGDLPKVTAAAPPPPPPAGGTITGVAADEAKRDAEMEKARRSDDSLAAKRKEMDARSRDLPPASATSGPSRSGPAQMQTNQNARNAVQMSVTRSAGGRKFTNRDGAWYDTAYKGQATTNIRRGSDEFKKLDAGLRAIASEVDGVVVVVWKDKAFRIQ